MGETFDQLFVILEAFVGNEISIQMEFSLPWRNINLGSLMQQPKKTWQHPGQLNCLFQLYHIVNQSSLKWQKVSNQNRRSSQKLISEKLCAPLIPFASNHRGRSIVRKLLLWSLCSLHVLSAQWVKILKQHTDDDSWWRHTVDLKSWEYRWKGRNTLQFVWNSLLFVKQ